MASLKALYHRLFDFETTLQSSKAKSIRGKLPEANNRVVKAAGFVFVAKSPLDERRVSMPAIPSR